MPGTVFSGMVQQKRTKPSALHKVFITLCSALGFADYSCVKVVLYANIIQPLHKVR